MSLISELDWPRILYKRSTAVLLGVAAVLQIPAAIILRSGINPDALVGTKRELVSLAGAGGALGFFPLLVCMGYFWLKCDTTSKMSRTIWFVLLLFGFAFGTQIAYYAVVYLPAVLRRLRDPQIEQPEEILPERATSRGRIGRFSKVLLIVWGSIALPMIVFLAIPKFVPKLLEILSVIFFLFSVVVVFEAIFHFIASSYRTGMKRSAHTDRKHLSRPWGRD